MPLFLADFLFSPTSTAASYIDADSPRIGISNVLSAGGISSPAGTLPANPAYLASLPSMDERWKAAGQAGYSIPWTLAEATEVDYVGIFGHRNLIETQVEFEFSLGGFVVKTVGPFLFTELGPMFKLFAPVECDSGRVMFVSTGPFDPEVSYIAVGQSVALPRKIYVGHSPMPFARRVSSRFSVSDNGAYLGQEIISVQTRTSVDVSNIPPDYYRDIIYPYFQRPAETQPFFWAWRPTTYPNEVTFAWLPDGNCRVSNERANGFMSFGFEMVGHADA